MSAIKRRCNKPGCLTLVRHGYCPTHQKVKHKQDRRARGSAAERGYDSRWRKVRAIKMATTPLCERCEKQGRTRAGDMVHHIQPLNEGGARLDMDNLQTLCNPCHAAIHAEHETMRAGY